MPPEDDDDDWLVVVADVHVLPEYSVEQEQVNELPLTVHVPPFWQGEGWQGVTASAHVGPVKPLGHAHE